MECDEEHIDRPGAEEQGSSHVDVSDHEQESEDSTSTTESWCDTEKDRSSPKALGGQTNSLLKRGSIAIQRVASNFQTPSLPSQDVVDTIMAELKSVEEQMCRLRLYIKAQEADNKPLYQWAAYEHFPTLNTSVSKLKKATAKLKATRLPSQYLRLCVESATTSSTSVSKASVDILAAMRKKFDNYMDEMEASTLSATAKHQASTAITEEIRKLIQHSTSATENVWQAHDLLRACEQRGEVQSWAWSVGATAMTALIATAVSLAMIYFSGPAHLDKLPARGANNAVCSQLVDLVQQSQDVTNLTSEMYKLKLQDIDRRYDDLVAGTEANRLRIDGIVDGLGPPNQEGTYYMSSVPTSNHEDSCEDHCQKVSGRMQAQLQQQQQELQMMRKTINRLDIRLTRGLEYGRKE